MAVSEVPPNADTAMPLTDIACRNAKPKDKLFKLADSKGLYLLVNAAGKYWRLNYRYGGKRKTLALGVYPEVSLAAARTSCDDARRMLASEVDPSMHRKVAKARHMATTVDTFQTVACEWFAKFSPGWASTHSEKIIRRLERDVFPWVGTKPIAEIEAKELLTVLRRIESRGKLETAHRVHQNCGQVFRYAVATGRARRDPSGDLKGALAPWRPQHYPSITEPVAIGELLRTIATFSGSLVTLSALKLSPLLFVRPGELRRAEWVEIDLEKAEWRIPAEKMKARVLHIVPLSNQAVAVLQELKPLTGGGKYIFPSIRTGLEPMSENTINAALRRMGYPKEQLTAHGFRSMASTLLNEQGWNRDAIERQLAHGDGNQVRAAYNYAEFMPERCKMMQAWADYLDRLRDDRKVVAGKFGRVA